MPKFKIVAREVQHYLAQIEAKDEEEAALIASELTEKDFDYLDGSDWEIVNIKQVYEKLKQGNLF